MFLGEERSRFYLQTVDCACRAVTAKQLGFLVQISTTLTEPKSKMFFDWLSFR